MGSRRAFRTKFVRTRAPSLTLNEQKLLINDENIAKIKKTFYPSLFRVVIVFVYISI